MSCVCFCVDIGFQFSGVCIWEKIDESSGSCVFNFLSNYQTVFQTDYIILLLATVKTTKNANSYHLLSAKY